jgi:hypothetical protein
VKLYSTGYLTYGASVPGDLEGFFDGGSVRDFNQENGSKLGHLGVGSFEDKTLYLVTYCKMVAPGEAARQGLRELTRKDQMIWKRQLKKFFRIHGIEHGEIGLWLLADLDN